MRYVVGDVEEFPPGTIRLFEVAGRSVGVVRCNGRFHAVRNRCPHRGAPVCRGNVSGTMLPSRPGEFVYGLDGRVLRCPWHGWEFDLEDGKALFGIDGRRLVTYPVHVEEGRVLVEIPGVEG